MWSSKGAGAICGSLGIMSAATIILWYVKLTEKNPHHLIYLYLLPVILIAILYNGRLALLSAAIAVLGADYFLQDPIYSLANDNPLEYGDMFCFAILAATAVKSICELMRPGTIQESPRLQNSVLSARRTTDPAQ